MKTQHSQKQMDLFFLIDVKHDGLIYIYCEMIITTSSTSICFFI